jgi:hypothetical protein
MAAPSQTHKSHWPASFSSCRVYWAMENLRPFVTTWLVKAVSKTGRTRSDWTTQESGRNKRTKKDQSLRPTPETEIPALLTLNESHVSHRHMKNQRERESRMAPGRHSGNYAQLVDVCCSCYDRPTALVKSTKRRRNVSKCDLCSAFA